MSHGYVDDTPGNEDFWLRFWNRTYSKRFLKMNPEMVKFEKQYHPKGIRLLNPIRIYHDLKHKIGMLKRLIGWKMNIKRLKKIYPNEKLKELEDRLVYLEVCGVMKAFWEKEE